MLLMSCAGLLASSVTMLISVSRYRDFILIKIHPIGGFAVAFTRKKNARAKGLTRDDGGTEQRVETNVSTYTPFSPFILSIPCLYYPFCFSISGIVFATRRCVPLLSRFKLQILSRMRKYVVRRSTTVALLRLFSLPSSCFPRITATFFFPFRDIGTRTTGFRQARMPLSALTVPLGSSPSEFRVERRARVSTRLPTAAGINA